MYGRVASEAIPLTVTARKFFVAYEPSEVEPALTLYCRYSSERSVSELPIPLMFIKPSTRAVAEKIEQVPRDICERTGVIKSITAFVSLFFFRSLLKAASSLALIRFG